MTSNQSAEPHGTYLVLGLLIAAGAVMFLWLAPRHQDNQDSQDNQDTEPETEASQAAATEPPPETTRVPGPQSAELKAAAPAEPKTQASAPPAGLSPQEHADLFAAPMPEFMERIYKRVDNNQWLNANDQKQLYQYGKEHKDDARPQLILAWDARNRDWDGIAARMYRIAFKADPRAKSDPSMLPDLLSIASRYDNVEYSESSSLIKDAYGAEALPEIEDEIGLATRRNEPRRVARLNRLRDALRAH